LRQVLTPGTHRDGLVWRSRRDFDTTICGHRALYLFALCTLVTLGKVVTEVSASRQEWWVAVLVATVAWERGKCVLRGRDRREVRGVQREREDSLVRVNVACVEARADNYGRHTRLLQDVAGSHSREGDVVLDPDLGECLEKRLEHLPATCGKL
jgi:hypothetical protein